MKFSYSWLCDHLDTNLSPLEIADTLTNIGLELESLTDYSSYAQFVVATIVDFKKTQGMRIFKEITKDKS